MILDQTCAPDIAKSRGYYALLPLVVQNRTLDDVAPQAHEASCAKKKFWRRSSDLNFGPWRAYNAPQLEAKPDARMVNQSSRNLLIRGMELFSQMACTICLGIGGLVLLDWSQALFDASFLPSWLIIRTDTAASFTLAGTSLWLQRRSPGKNETRSPKKSRLVLARLLALSVVILSILTLLAQSQALSTLHHTEFFGAPAPNSALIFFLVGLSLFLFDIRFISDRYLSEPLALAAICLSLPAIIGYIFGVDSFPSIVAFTRMSIPAAVLFLTLCLGLLFARPDRGFMKVITSESAGGIMARRLLPAAILVPTILGWLRVEGQRAGLYTSEFGSALTATSTILILLIITWTTGRSLNSIDSVRRMAEEEIRKLNVRLEGRVRERTQQLEDVNGQLQTQIQELQRAEERLVKTSQRLRELAARLTSVREEERIHISREIHDELGQSLTALKLDLSWLFRRLPEGETALSERARSTIELVDATIQSVRKICSELRPSILDDLGLSAAIEWQTQEFQRRAGIECQFYASAEFPGLDRKRSEAIFRIYQEILTNIARHSGALRIQVLLTRDDRDIVLQVHDNGRGISDEEIMQSKSLGLLGMKERAVMLGGEIHFRGSREEGTTVRIRIPLENGSGKEIFANDKHPDR